MSRCLRTVAFPVFTILIIAGCRRDTVTPNTAPAPSSGSTAAAPSAGSRRSSAPILSYSDIVDRVSPAVVIIRSARRARAPRQFPFGDDPFFRRFFGRGPRTDDGGGPGDVEQGLGSGVIVAGDGHILTNHHVVDGAEEIKVDLIDHRTLSANLVGSDAPSDLAVLKVSAQNLPALTLADSDRVRVGDICLALGNPLGIGQTVTSGIISAKSRSTGLSNGSFEDFLQTDAPADQSGVMGGALVNTRGELIGINSQILSTTGGNIGIGFAIPSNMAKGVMEQLNRQGKVRRGQLGVSIQPVTSDAAAKVGLKDMRGVLVNSVESGGPADKAGIRPGDAIIAMNGAPVEDQFRNRVASTLPGSQVTLTVVRNGREQQLSATLGEWTPPAAGFNQRSRR